MTPCKTDEMSLSFGSTKTNEHEKEMDRRLHRWSHYCFPLADPVMDSNWHTRQPNEIHACPKGDHECAVYEHHRRRAILDAFSGYQKGEAGYDEGFRR